MKKLIEALLNDDHGISEHAYFALLEYMRQLGYEHSEKEAERDLYWKVSMADATDGRFYFSS